MPLRLKRDSDGGLFLCCGGQEQFEPEPVASAKIFNVGDRITLHSLKMTHMNGKSGKIVNFIADEGRYEIELDGETCPIKVVPFKIKDEEIDHEKIRQEEKKKYEEYMKVMMEEARETREQLRKVNEQLSYIERQQEDFIMTASMAGRSRPVDHVDLTNVQHELNNKLEIIADKIETTKSVITELDYDLDMKDTTLDTEDSFDSPSPSPPKTKRSSRLTLHKLDKRVQEVGKTIKNSKTQVSWTFQEGNRDTIHHNVTLTWSKGSGRVTIDMDKKRFLSIKLLSESSDPYFIHKWESVDGLKMQILASRKVGSTLSLKNHELTVNGVRFTSFPSLLG